MACSGVVDYPFYLPTGVNESSLDTIASAQLSNPSFTFLSPECRVALKRIVCVSIYRRRRPDYRLANETTWVSRKLKSTRGISTHFQYDNSSSPIEEVVLNIHLPYMRPCVSLCIDLASNSCQDVLELFDIQLSPAPPWDSLDGTAGYSRRLFNCSSEGSREEYLPFLPHSFNLTDYELPTTYDFSHDTSTCTSISSQISVASSQERYLFSNASEISKGACTDIVTELFVPISGKTAFPGSAALEVLPFSGPFVYQNAAEQAVREILSTAPVWLSKKCFASLRALACTSLMLEPRRANLVLSTTTMKQYKMNSTTVVGNFTFFVPSYPMKSFCESFIENCDGTMSNLWFNTGAAAKYLAISCSERATDSGVTIDLYPTFNQTVSTFKLNLPLGISSIKAKSSAEVSFSQSTLNITSFPGYSSSSSLASLSRAWSVSIGSWDTVCPRYGFVYPQDISNVRNIWIGGTACTLPCRRPVVTADGYRQIDAISFIAPAIGLPMILLALFFTSQNYDHQSLLWKRSLFMRCACNLSALASIGLLATRLPSYDNLAKVFCHNNALPQMQEIDGVTMCTVQASILFLTSLGLTLLWTAQSVFILLRIVGRCRHLDSYYTPVATAAIAIAVICTVLAGWLKLFGYPGNSTWCIYVNHDGGETPFAVVILLYGNGLICGIIGTVSLVSSWIIYLVTLMRSRRLLTPQEMMIVTPHSPSRAAGSVDHNIAATVSAEDGAIGNGSNTQPLNFPRHWIRVIMKALKSTAPTVVFHVSFAIIWSAILLYPIAYAAHRNRLETSKADWNQCMFNFFRYGLRENDDSWKEECGPTPYGNEYSNQTTLNWSVLVCSGQSIIFTVAFAPWWFQQSTGTVARYYNWRQRLRTLASAVVHQPRGNFVSREGRAGTAVAPIGPVVSFGVRSNLHSTGDAVFAAVAPDLPIRDGSNLHFNKRSASVTPGIPIGEGVDVVQLDRSRAHSTS